MTADGMDTLGRGSARARPRDAAVARGRDGSAMVAALLIAITLAFLVGGIVTLSVAAERARAAASAAPAAENAAAGAVELLSERLRSVAQRNLGVISQADIDALNAGVATLPVDPEAPLDPAETGFRVARVREGERIDDDAAVLDVWTDQPRIRYGAIPRPQGLVAARTVEVEIRARARRADGRAQRTLTRTLAISRVMPHQHALYHAGGAAEICAAESPGSWIGGGARFDAAAWLPGCRYPVAYGGAIEARDGVASDPARHHFLPSAGEVLGVAGWTRDAAAADPRGVLASTLGYLRIPPAWGGTFEETRMQSAAVAGTGECPDIEGVSGYCGGNGYFGPGVVVRRFGTSPTSTPTIVCAQAYLYAPTCIPGVSAALSYRPSPFTPAPAPGLAAADPATGRPWRGIFPDGRREARCAATVAGHVFRTHRCPSNPHGYVLDLGALPPIRGGLMAFLHASVPAPATALGSREVLVIRNARRLAAPLAITTTLPVVIVGSLNVEPQPAWRGPPPLMITAPRILLLPAEADEQAGIRLGSVGWAAVWDSVGFEGSPDPSALPITAAENVTLYAVLRTGVCSSREGAYFGGSWEGAPGLLGDWSRVALRIIGAVETVDEPGSAAACADRAGRVGAEGADGTPIRAPNSRVLLHDPRLLHGDFRIPGSYLPDNIPVSGVPGAAQRTPARQANAAGGTVVVRVTRETGRRAARPTKPFPAPSPLPMPPPPLP